MENEPQEKPPEPPKQKFLPFWTLLLVGAFLVAVLLGALGFGVYWVRSKDLQAKRLQDAVENQKKIDALEQTKAGEAAKVAIAQGRQQEVMAQLKTATNSLTKLLESVVRANTEAQALKTNAAGKAIAQFPDLVLQARRIYEGELANLPKRDDVVARLEGTRRAQHELSANLGTAYNPDADMAVTAQNTAVWAEQSLQKSSAFEAYLSNLITDSQVKIAAQPLTPASPTLAEAINQLVAAESGQRLQTIANNTVAAKSVAADTVADAEAKRIVEEAKLEAAKILRDANLKAATNSIEESKNAVAVQEAQSAAQKIKLREKASRPEIQSQLAAYLTPGYWTPKPGEANTYDKKGMSLSELREMGALNPSFNGLRSFIAIGANPHNDRPRLQREFLWTWWNNPALQDQAKAMQQLMIELGPTFVEMGVMEK